MTAPIFPARSWGGGVLRGDRIVRLVYLDEAGISNREEEPFTVVSAVLVNPDKQWKLLDEHFRDLANDVFPGRDPYRFIFHAKDIWHGRGDFPKDEWKLLERRGVLRRLAQIPRLFSLPIIIGYVKRLPTDTPIFSDIKPRQRNAKMQYWDIYLAFIKAVNTVDRWVSQNHPDEVTMLIMEDGGKINRALGMFHEGYSGPLPDDANDEYGRFRTNHIIEGIVFKKKRESVPLQTADHCAFIAKRHLMKKSDIREFYTIIEPHVEWGELPDKPLYIPSEMPPPLAPMRKEFHDDWADED